MTEDVTLTEWYLVRHAPVKNSRKGIYREEDAPAELPALSVIKALAKTLPENADWYVSPLSRTRATATALLQAKGLDPESMKITQNLREQDFGDWQGLAFEEIWEEVKGLEAHNWSLLAAGTTPPQGESFVDVLTRITGFVQEVTEGKVTRPKVLVTHAGIIRAFVGTAMGLSADKALALDARPFSLTRLLQQSGQGKGGQWQLLCLNQKFDD